MKTGYRSFLLASVALAALAMLCLGSPVAAQAPPSAPMSAPRYDTATETTLTGTVEAVTQVTGRHGWHGTHLTLKTEKETVDVHVGPSWFLDHKHFALAKGDEVEVSGSRVKYSDGEALIAREIKKGDQILVLRNAQGLPLWSRGSRRKPAM
jgi:hypothetical protein